jgi:hypothetical protein
MNRTLRNLGLLISSALVFSGAACDRSGNSAIVPQPTTCVDAHMSVTDSICNMAGTWSGYEHHVHTQYDSGVLVTLITRDTTGINISINVSPTKSVSYLNQAYSLVSSNDSQLHFTNHNLPNGSYVDIFYNPVKASFVVASVTNTPQAGITITDIDTLFTYW